MEKEDPKRSLSKALLQFLQQAQPLFATLITAVDRAQL